MAGLTHKGTAFVFLWVYEDSRTADLCLSSLLLSLSSLCLSCLSCLSLSRPLPLESRVIASSVVSRRVSPRREESRVIASSVVSRRLSSRCASSRSPCASSELLDVSHVV